METLTRDPYAVWARDILKLFPMDRPDQAADARARGSAIHKAFEELALRHPVALPATAAEEFEALYLHHLEAGGVAHEALARERALAREAGRWIAELEAARRADGRTIHVELRGETTFEAPAGTFTLTARADRIEAAPGGLGHILDFKTGSPPSAKEVNVGFAPQLTLTAAILARGGFPELGELTPGELTYLQITGRKPAGRVHVRAEAGAEAEAAADKAFRGVEKLVAGYDKPDQPYLSRVAPQFLGRFTDYDHLARVFEWSTSGEDEEP